MCCCIFDCFKKLVVGICSLLKAALATAIIIIVTTKLFEVSITTDIDSVLKAECLMTGNVQGGSVCRYTYAVCGLSLLLSAALSMLLCLTCNMCGLGSWLEFIVSGFLTAWWIIASLVITKKVQESNDLGIPREEWRNAVAVMAWASALLAFITALVCFIDACTCIKECCSCCCRDDEPKTRANAV